MISGNPRQLLIHQNNLQCKQSCDHHHTQVQIAPPAAIGPYCVPVVNLEANVDQLNVNMVTCGGQATIPMVAAVSRVARVHYAEIIASIASKSAAVQNTDYCINISVKLLIKVLP